MRLVRRTDKSTYGDLVVGARPGEVIIGLDLSLSGTGVAVFHNGVLVSVRGWTKVKSLSKSHSGTLCWYNAPEATESNRVHRLRAVYKWLVESVLRPAVEVTNGNVLLSIEGYAFSRHGAGHADAHGLCESVKLWAMDEGVPVRVYPPTQLKKAVTGHGKADKSDMKLAVYRLWRQGWITSVLTMDFTEYQSAGENIADAVALAFLLSVEMSVRIGSVDPKNLPEPIREVLLEKTRKAPAALIDKPFIHRSSVTSPEPILAEDEVTF